MRPLYTKVKVVYDGRAECYDVYVKNWFRWLLKERLFYDKDNLSKYHTHFRNKEQAEQRAIEIANGLLESKLVYEKTKIL